MRQDVVNNKLKDVPPKNTVESASRTDDV